MVQQKSKVDRPLIFFSKEGGVKLENKPFGELFDGPILYLLRTFFQFKCKWETKNLLTGADSSTAAKKLLSIFFTPPRRRRRQGAFGQKKKMSFCYVW